MRTILYTISHILFSLLLVACWEEEPFMLEEEGEVLVNVDVPAVLSFLPEDTQEVSFDINLSVNDQVQVNEVLIYLSLEIGDQITQEVPITTAAGRLQLTRDQLLNQIPANGAPGNNGAGNAFTGNIDQLVKGDQWVIRYEIILADGRVIQPAKKTVIEFVCIYNIEGNYRATSNGFFGDGEGNQNETSPFTLVTDVEFNRLDEQSYMVNDITFGLYPFEYLQDEVEMELNTDCLEVFANFITQLTTQDDSIEVEFELQGEMDRQNERIIIEWVNSYGDVGTTILVKL